MGGRIGSALQRSCDQAFRIVRYLLDTSAWVAYLRNSNPQLVWKLRSSARRQIALSAVVLSELERGVQNATSTHRARHRKSLSTIIQIYELIPFDKKAAMIAGGILSQMDSDGLPIGGFDVLIAATAIANNLVLVTHNVGEFSRVPNLIYEDWES